jgi:hypothetical protein
VDTNTQDDGGVHTQQKHQTEIALSEDLKGTLIVDDDVIIPSTVPHLTVGATLNKCVNNSTSNI